MLKVAPYNTGVRMQTFAGEQKKKDKKYTDPLMNWPIRGLAYSNELGAALSEIAPTLGTLLWFPAMLYFGADIYDKYKNEKTSYDPNAQRGTEQAIFQLLASVILPTASVIAGQKTASAMGAMGKTGLTLQTQEEVTNFLREFSSRRHLEKFKDNPDSFKEHFMEAFVTKRENLIREHKIKNPIKFVADTIFTRRHPEAIAMSEKDKIMSYANENIDSMFKIYGDLMEDRKPEEFSDKMWKNFHKLKEKYIRDPEYKATYLRDASEDIIRKYFKGKMTNTKMLKTVGGFVALGIAIKPIDKFVEKVIIKKVVEPNLNTVFNNNNNNNGSGVSLNKTA